MKPFATLRSTVVLFSFFQNGRVNNVRLNQCKKISIQLPASSMASFIFVTIFRQSYFNSFMQGTLVRRNGGHVGGGRCLQRRPPTSNLICDVDGCSLVFPTFNPFGAVNKLFLISKVLPLVAKFCFCKPRDLFCIYIDDNVNFSVSRNLDGFSFLLQTLRQYGICSAVWFSSFNFSTWFKFSIWSFPLSLIEMDLSDLTMQNT